MPAITQEQLQQLSHDGYVVVENVLDPTRDLDPVMREYAAVLDRVAATLYAAGRISSNYAELPFEQRLVEVCAESRELFAQHFDISLPQVSVARADTPMHTGPAVFHLLSNRRLLDCVEAVIGPEILSNPVQHVRIKLPPRAIHTDRPGGLVAAVPWHQDNGVVLPEADETNMLTVWIALSDATLANGCLQVVPYSHQDGLAAHCPTARGLSIPDPLVPEARAMALPMRAGSVLFMHRRTMHNSLENRTADQVRWSFDLRYQPIGQPTGRPAFPAFVARSRAHPEQELRDPAQWAALWAATRARLAAAAPQAFNRWSADHPACA